MSFESSSVTPVHAGNALLEQPGHIKNGSTGPLCVIQHTSRMHQSTEQRMHLSHVVNKFFSSGLDATQVYAKGGMGLRTPSQCCRTGTGTRICM